MRIQDTLKEGLKMDDCNRRKFIKQTLFLMLTVLLSFFLSCTNKNQETYEPVSIKRSYLEIPIDSLGNLPRNPYFFELKKRNKVLRVYGTLHVNDTTNETFDIIERGITKFKPDVIIHEGGILKKSYSSRNQAILNNGEIGLIKYLSDQAGYTLMNGDLDFKDEFNGLLKHYPREEVLYYYITQRFVFPLIHFLSESNVDSLYAHDFISGYVASSGISLSGEEKQLSYYYQLYKKNNGKEFNISDLDYNDFSPIIEGGYYNEMARKSAGLRDDNLLRTVKKYLAKYDRVMVVFGGWHVLVIEPELEKMMQLVPK